MNAPDPRASIPARTIAVLAVAGTLAVAGAALRIACVGQSCTKAEPATAQAPFCGLPDRVRNEIVNGFRDGRSPNILAATGASVVRGSSGSSSVRPPWPSTDVPSEDLPLIFWGRGVVARVDILEGTTLDRIAPTLAGVMGLERPFPEVRSGTEIPEVASGEPPRLVVEIVVKGHDASTLEASEALNDLAAEGSATMGATAGTAPVDPAALVTTIGTGGMPRQHGVTGTLLRNDAGRLVRAWGPEAPQLVIATLADDLDELNAQEPRVGLVAVDRSDLGLVDGTWYIEHDRDDIVILPGAASLRVADRAIEYLEEGYGSDTTPDLLAVTLDGKVTQIDRAIRRIVEAGRLVSDGSVAVAVTSTGASARAADLEAEEIAMGVNATAGAEVVEGTAVGGFFIDQQVLADGQLSEDEILRNLAAISPGDGTRVFEDVFTSIAVTFERYC